MPEIKNCEQYVLNELMNEKQKNYELENQFNDLEKQFDDLYQAYSGLEKENKKLNDCIKDQTEIIRCLKIRLGEK